MLVDNSFFVREILSQTHYVDAWSNNCRRNHRLRLGFFFLVAFLRLRHWFLFVRLVSLFDDVSCTLDLERSKLHHQGDRHK